MTPTISRRFTMQTALAGAVLSVISGRAASASDATLSADLDAVLQESMNGSDGVGASVAVVRGDEVVLSKGYGLRRLGDAQPVTDRTLFGIGSCTKAFTAAALARLVDEGRLDWADPVVSHLPEFAMSDPDVTRSMTVRDLLLHVSGLSLGAGDLMIWPYTTHSRAEIVAGLRHLPLSRPFRSGYAYDNVLYVAAGEVVARLRGHALEDEFEALLRAAGFRDATALPTRARASGDLASYHVRFGGERRGEGALQPLPSKSDGVTNDLAAGGLMFSARDLARWMRIHLADGAMPEGGRLWSRQQQEAMWRPGVVISVRDGATPDRPDRSNFDTYALGWQISDYRGRRLVWHGGYSPGNMTMIAMLPAIRAGVAVVVNSEDGVFGRVSRNTALDRLMGVTDIDWLARVRAQPPRAPAADGELQPKGSAPPRRTLSAYAGRYRDAWYGDVVVTHDGEALSIDFTKTPGMQGRLEPWGGETFLTRFEDRALEDALATFDLGGAGGATITMKAWSPDADFSYDFQDLRLRRVD